MHNERPDRFAALAQRLPFAVDDYDGARTAYVRWHQTRATADREVVEIWAYCYVLTYFYTRFASERTAGASDLDMAVTRAVRRIFRSLESVRDPERFPQFVSVVCRRVLLSHRERRRPMGDLDEWTGAIEEAPDTYDRHLVRYLLDRAIRRLPGVTAQAARLRLLEGASYSDIAAAMHREVPTVRTYVSRALAKLRKDPDVQALYDETLGGDSGEDAEEPDPDVRSSSQTGLEP